MTEREAKAFLNNLKVCIEEHPIVADWLVEIADRKTENSSEIPNNSTISKMEQVDEPQTPYDNCQSCLHWVYDGYWYCECNECRYEPKDEPQTDMAEDIVRSYGFKAESYQQAKAKDEPQDEYAKEYEELGLRKLKELRKDEPQTDCAWK